MEKNIVYHGSNVEVSIPRILQNGFTRISDMDFTVPVLKNKQSGGQ